jgi:hypothetical protein
MKPNFNYRVKRPKQLIDSLRAALAENPTYQAWETKILVNHGFDPANMGDCSRQVYLSPKWVLKTTEEGSPDFEITVVRKHVPKEVRPQIWAVDNEWLLMPRYHFDESETHMVRGLSVLNKYKKEFFDTDKPSNWAYCRKRRFPVLIDGWGDGTPDGNSPNYYHSDY